MPSRSARTARIEMLSVSRKTPCQSLSQSARTARIEISRGPPWCRTGRRCGPQGPQGLKDGDIGDSFLSVI